MEEDVHISQVEFSFSTICELHSVHYERMSIYIGSKYLMYHQYQFLYISMTILELDQ